MGRTSLRRWLFGTLLGGAGLAAVDAFWIEPRWLKVRRIRLTGGPGSQRVVHFTDLHHKGDRSFLEKVVRTINEQKPDFVCFTGDIIGDLVEKPSFLEDALPVLAQIKAPLYGVPGNHDYWSKVAFEPIARTFSRTGGRWMVDDQVLTRDGKVTVTGFSCQSRRPERLRPNGATKNVLLLHYPGWVKELGQDKFDLILAGHSHGGQVRLPGIGGVSIPFGVDEFEVGLFRTANGPMYVNPGIGWFIVPARFNCRPEVTVIEF